MSVILVAVVAKSGRTRVAMGDDYYQRFCFCKKHGVLDEQRGDYESIFNSKVSENV